MAAKKPETVNPEQAHNGHQDATENPAPKMAPGPTIKRKLTTRDIMGKTIKAKDLPEDGSSIELYIIAGYANSVKTGQSNYGDWSSLDGDFSAIRKDTGEIYMAENAFVPGPMGDALVSAVISRGGAVVPVDKNGKPTDAAAAALAAKQKLEKAMSVRFKLMVSARRSPRQPDEKVEYDVRPMIDAALASPSMELLGFNG